MFKMSGQMCVIFNLLNDLPGVVGKKLSGIEIQVNKLIGDGAGNITEISG